MYHLKWCVQEKTGENYELLIHLYWVGTEQRYTPHTQTNTPPPTSLSLSSYHTHTHTFHLPLSWELWCVCVCAWMIYSMPSTTAGCLLGWHVVHLSRGVYSCVSVREVTTRLSYLSECWYSKRKIFSSTPPLPPSWKNQLKRTSAGLPLWIFPHSLEKIPLLFPLWSSDNHSTAICLPPPPLLSFDPGHPQPSKNFFAIFLE